MDRRFGAGAARDSGGDALAASRGRSFSVRRVGCAVVLCDGRNVRARDFAGGMLKYLRGHPVPRLTIAGGVAKITKLAQGLLDLHSARGRVDLAALAQLARSAGGSAAVAERILGANTTPEAFAFAAAEGIALGEVVAGRAWATAAEVIAGSGTVLDVAIFDREGQLVAQSAAVAVP